MRKRRLIESSLIFACTFASAGGLQAQTSVRALEDLVGVRASSGEDQLRRRGYEFVHVEKTGDSAYAFWREPATNRCVSVRTTNGAYGAIAYTDASDCEAPSATPAPPAEDDGSFETVCGVETGGKTYRYRCRLRNEGCEGQGYCRSVLTFPDNELRINWLKDAEIEVEAEGTKPAKSTSSFRDGQTRFDYGGNTYFLYRSPERAKKELANLKD